MIKMKTVLQHKLCSKKFKKKNKQKKNIRKHMKVKKLLIIQQVNILINFFFSFSLFFEYLCEE